MRVKILLAILFLTAGHSALAMDRQLVFGGEKTIGVMGGPMFRYINIVDRSKILLGGQVALLINKHLYVGGGGGGTARDIGGGYSSTSYGGAYLGTFIQPQKAIHYYVDVGFWSGNISPGGSSNAGMSGAEDFLILEPSAGVALNLMEYAKLIAGISYRYVDLVDDSALESDDLGGLSMHATVLFGTF